MHILNLFLFMLFLLFFFLFVKKKIYFCIWLNALWAPLITKIWTIQISFPFIVCDQRCDLIDSSSPSLSSVILNILNCSLLHTLFICLIAKMLVLFIRKFYIYSSINSININWEAAVYNIVLYTFYIRLVLNMKYYYSL